MSVAEGIVKRSIAYARARVGEHMDSVMTSTVRVTRGSDAVLSADGVLTMDPDAPVVYEGPARLGNASGPVTYSLGEEVQFFSSGTCTVPLTQPLVDDTGATVLGEWMPVDCRVNDLLLVTSGDDPVLVGRAFRVVDVENVGLLPGARRLQIVGVQRYPGWVDSAVRHPVVGMMPDEVPPEWRI